MEYIEISDSTVLSLRIMQLRTEKLNCESELKKTFNELTQLIFNPGSIKEESINTIQDNKRDFLNLTKMVLNKTTNYIIEQKFGQKHSFNDFLISMAGELLSSQFINKKIWKLFSHFSNRVAGRSVGNN